MGMLQDEGPPMDHHIQFFIAVKHLQGILGANVKTRPYVVVGSSSFSIEVQNIPRQTVPSPYSKGIVLNKQ